MTDIAKLAIALDTKSLEAGLVQLDKLGKKSGASELAMQKLKKESSALAIGQSKLAQINAKLDTETDELARSTLIAARSNQEYANSIAAASVKSQALAIQTGKAEKATNGMGGASRNLSFQLNQVAQQGAVTGNYLGALAIQLPDMLLSFGTLGILVGAAAGVMAGPLLTALSDTEGQTADTREEIEELINKFDELGSAQKELLRINLAEDQKKLKKEIREAKGDYETAVFQLDRLISSYEKGRIGIIEYKEEQNRLNRVIATNKAVIEENNNTLKERDAILNGQTKLEVERATAIQRTQLDLADQLAALTLNNSELLKRELILNGATDAEIASALAMQGSIEKIEAETDALKKQEALRSSLSSQLASIEVQQADPAERARLQFERRNEVIQLSNDELNLSQERYDQLRTQNAEKLSADLIAIENRTQEQKSQILSAEQQKTLGYTGQFFGNLADIAKQGGKEQFDNYKALASTQALISASLAVLGVLGDQSIPTIAKPAFATAMAGLAAVQIAAINQQEYQGARAMGGQVSSGNSYLVGENGPEIVHMNGNGNVQANHNLGGGENNVTVNVNIQSGVTKAELAGLLPSINQSVYNQVFAAINGGGSASQAVRRRA